ncbi:MAG: hypothetical protein ACK4N5_07065, partial [Myxococcales bacterium]
GAIYSRQGARAGRDMLATHQKLLKLNTLIGRLGELFDDEDAQPDDVKSLAREIETLLKKAREAATRSDTVVATLTARS